jgi:hypothetical protein
VRLLRDARTAITDGRFGSWRAEFHDRWRTRGALAPD